MGRYRQGVFNHPLPDLWSRHGAGCRRQVFGHQAGKRQPKAAGALGIDQASDGLQLAALFRRPDLHDRPGDPALHDAGTGKERWTLRVEGTYAASPLLADGKIYLLSEEGIATIIEPAAEGKILATNKIPDTFLATPVAANGALFLRSDKYLYCIADKAK